MLQNFGFKKFYVFVFKGASNTPKEQGSSHEKQMATGMIIFETLFR